MIYFYLIFLNYGLSFSTRSCHGIEILLCYLLVYGGSKYTEDFCSGSRYYVDFSILVEGGMDK